MWIHMLEMWIRKLDQFFFCGNLSEWVNNLAKFSANFLLVNHVDGGAKGVHALQWLCKKSWEAYLEDGRWVKCHDPLITFQY